MAVYPCCEVFEWKRQKHDQAVAMANSSICKGKQLFITIYDVEKDRIPKKGRAKCL